MNPGKRGKKIGKALRKLDKKLGNREFAVRVVRNVALKRRQRNLDARILRLRKKLITAKGRQKAEIKQLIGRLEKTREIGEKAFFER